MYTTFIHRKSLRHICVKYIRDICCVINALSIVSVSYTPSYVDARIQEDCYFFLNYFLHYAGVKLEFIKY